MRVFFAQNELCQAVADFQFSQLRRHLQAVHECYPYPTKKQSEGEEDRRTNRSLTRSSSAATFLPPPPRSPCLRKADRRILCSRRTVARCVARGRRFSKTGETENGEGGSVFGCWWGCSDRYRFPVSRSSTEDLPSPLLDETSLFRTTYPSAMHRFTLLLRSLHRRACR